MSIASIRQEYEKHVLLEDTAKSTPIDQFALWFDEALAAKVPEPTAMTLATAGADGFPAARTVLLKHFDERGFVFYTNFQSQKGQEILGTMKAALVFHWKSLRRQVRVRGIVEEVSKAEADDYFASRPRDSRIGAWASQQSRPLESRFALETAVAVNTAKYAIGEVPRPAHWSGFRIKPLAIEFWHDRPFRLHDRVVFRRPDDNAQWSKARLYP